MNHATTGVLLIVFVIVSVFGLFLLLSHSGHHDACPLHAAGQVMCESTLLEHVSIWQSMFASLALALVLALGLSWIARLEDDAARSFEHVRHRIRTIESKRPTLLQILYARGILNRKEPYCF